MTPRQALAWIEKHKAHVTRRTFVANDHAPWKVVVSYGKRNQASLGATLPEAVDQARDAITKRFRVDVWDDTQDPIAGWVPSGHFKTLADAVLRQRARRAQGDWVRIVRIVRKVNP